jgi:IclR family transcriptional regulator, acetate operon repressor
MWYAAAVMSVGDSVGGTAATGRPGSGIRSMNSVLSTLRVLEEVAMRQPVGVSDLARATGIPKSSVQRCLITLQEAGWLRVSDPERIRWGLTMKALALGVRSAGERDLRELADPVMKRLAAETAETVFLGLRDGAEFLIIARADSTQVIRVFMETGTRVPLRASSGGVAIIARLSAAEADELLRPELSQFAGTPVPTAEETKAEIDRTAGRGYALDMSSWYRPHVASIGAAITNSAGRPIAAITLAIPEMRYDRAQEEALARSVVAAADEVSRLIAAA